MIQKQAQRNARICRVIPMLVWVAIIVITAVWTFVMRRPTLGTLLMLFNVLWLPGFVQGMLIKKYVEGALNRGEYELYYESLRALSLEDERSLMYAEVLFYDGAYQRLINICTANVIELKDKQSKRKRRMCYFYLYHLARVYFRLADYAKLAQVCQAFRTKLQSEKSALQKQLAPYQSILKMYEMYIQGDASGVLAAVDESESKGGAMVQYGYMLIRARVAAELQGDAAGAAETYTRIMQESPLQEQRELAQKALDNLQQGLSYGYGNPELVPEEGYVLCESDAHKRARRRGLVLGVIMAFLWLCSFIPTVFRNGEFDRLEQNLEREYKKMDVLAAVSVPSEHGQEDSVYVATQGQGVVLGIYRPASKQDMHYYFVRYDSIPVSQLIESPESEQVYCGDLEHEYLIKGRFYANEQDIPNGCTYTAFRVRGTKRYFAVLGKAPLYPVYDIHDGAILVDNVIVDATESEVCIQTSYVQGESTRVYLRELESVSLQTLADASVLLTPKAFTSIDGQYTYVCCFYRSQEDVPTDIYARYPIQVGEQTYYYAILSVEKN